jgi:hypothetical protein
MSTVVIHGNVQAQSVAEQGLDVINRTEIVSILADFALAAPVLSVTTSPYQVPVDKNTIIATVPCTLNLPTASSVPNKVYNIKRASELGPVYVVPAGTELIDGKSAIQITVQYASMSIVSDGTAWWIF